MKKVSLLFVLILIIILFTTVVYAAPTVNLLSPANGSTNTTGEVTFICNASDTTNLKNSTVYIWNSTSIVSTYFANVSGLANITTSDVQLLPNENYEWNCLFFNNNSNSSWASSNNTLRVQVNLTSSLVAPTHASTVTTENVTLNFSTNLASICKVHVWNSTGNGGGIKISTSDNISCDTDANYTLTGLPDREYLWTVNCTDVFNESNFYTALERTFTLDAVPPLDITLLYPTSGAVVQSNFFEFNFSVNETANCTFYWNFSMGEAGNWGTEGFYQSAIADTVINFSNMMGPNIGVLWNALCYDSNGGTSWASSNETFIVNGSMPNCFGLNTATCASTENCTWGDFAGGCFYDCVQFDAVAGGNQSQCENAYGGELCSWFSEGGICDPVVFDKGFEGFSFCFNYDANETACDNFSDDCAWFSEPGCSAGQPCYDSVGSNHGWCDPTGFNFGGDYNCWTYDGNETGCFYSTDTLGWGCQWNPDPWGPLIAGNNSGYCTGMMGGGSSGSGCWDAFDEDDCNANAAIGMPCTWQNGTSESWCEQKGCWDYWTSDDCNANINEGCLWNSDYNYCYGVGCWDIVNNTNCSTANITYGLDCIWQGSASNGWCEEEGCWLRDWTNQTYCESKEGCTWSGNWCNQKGCWDFDSELETNCTNNTYTGLNCEWKTGSWSFCEQQGCWGYDGNQSGCENNTVGLNCQWDGSNFCYEVMGGCTDFDNDEFGCYNTFWCSWNVSNNTCIDPTAIETNFVNPDCWIFDQGGQGPCNNITTCNWSVSNSNCENNGVGASGVQCVDINNSQMCNSLPMLSTCCMWNGTGCEDASFTTSCWDNVQEPPEGASFCEDYNAISSQQICNQIAGDPWYKPCLWNNVSEQCTFAFDNFDPGMGLGDLTEANCADAGGEWIVNTWVNNEGIIQFDGWCEMSFGFGTQTCAESCWACEQQDNGSVWGSNASARSACEQSTAGCVFFEDTNAYNGFGWCDMNWQYQGNCENNCFDCWDTDMCTDSVAGCAWLTDSWNNNTGWCQDENAQTCDDDCYLCWDQNNCINSNNDCTWDVNSWFCVPSGSGSGSSSEVCFDGIDNDADNFVDCADSECTFDSFCGGAGVFGSDCPSIPNNNTCLNESGCVWITDQWNNSWCDMEGSQCWTFDSNETACDAEEGCHYKSMQENNISDTFCDINFSIMESSSCWDYSNQTSCDAQSASGCTWMEDTWCANEGENESWCQENPNAGWCDHEIWSCHNFNGNQTACELDDNCGWMIDWFDPNWGWCDPACFSRNSTACEDPVGGIAGICESRNASEMAWCEPDNMFTGCWDHYNESSCDTDNVTCIWVADLMMPGNGFCGDLFMHGMTQNMDPSPPLFIANEDCIAGSYNESDICSLGIKDSPEHFGLATGVYSMNEAAICGNKFSEFTGNTTTKYYWYLDSNNNLTGGCSPDDDALLVGFDLKFKFEASIVNDVLVETKVSYKCIAGTWSPSMIRTTSWPDKMCYMIIGGVLAIDKEDLNSLSVLNLYDETADMRIYATTIVGNGSSAEPYDRIGPVWYSQGSADFMFEDCAGFIDMDGDGLLPDDDPDCADFLRYGYINLETGSQCNDNIDNDGNGNVDCDDAGCMYDSYFCSLADVTDYAAPTITWFETEEFNNGAFVGVDTDEPTNATLYFHKNNSYCSNNLTETIVIDDWKLSNAFDDDDYDFWHDFFVDQFYFDENSISYNIVNSSVYYFKLKLCDISGNCAMSACTNFTTTNQTTYYVIGFNLPPPESDITSYLGKVVVLFDLNGDGNFSDTIDSGTGIQVNDTAGRNVNIRFTNLNATDTWSVDFIGADLLSALTLNITDTFIVNDTAGGEALVGMDSDKWVELAQRLGVDYVRIEIPVGLPAGTDGQLIHCPDDVIDLTDASCVELDMTDINCTFNVASTVCYIPTSVGFSVFGVVEDDGSSGSGSSGGSGADSSGGVSSTSFWNRTFNVSDIDFAAGYTKLLANTHRLKVYVDEDRHYVGVVAITSTTAVVNVSSVTQQEIFSAGEMHKFDVTEDNYYDISVLLNNIYNNSANLTIKSLHELVVDSVGDDNQTIGSTTIDESDGITDGAGEDHELSEEKQNLGTIISSISMPLVIVILVFIVLIVVVILASKKKYHELNSNKNQ